MFVFLWAFHVQPATPVLGWIIDLTEKNVVCVEVGSSLAAWGSKCNMLKLLFNFAHVLNFKVTLSAT